ncbi:hypothetical protein QFC22_006414 [Naganishia vaughanmartiniae]|uniref:Uncharacterized protein n=1 Tax=Naganishia vaughanmartiniae TaxID=1424756 RepID=A0ACC2WK87_9TREE|nr:hypothetical protein QFC22_006414 [Naganishia vaughanmartiniae]
MSAAQYYDKTSQPQGEYVPPTYPVPPTGQQYQQQQYAPPSMPATAPYAEPSQYAGPSFKPNDPNNTQQYAVSDGNEKTGQRFRPKKRFNDPIFAILFIACFIGFVALSAIVIRQFVKYGGGGGGFGDIGGTSATLDYHTVYLLLVASGLALVLAFVWLMIVRQFTKVIMEITLALSVVFNIGVCVCKSPSPPTAEIPPAETRIPLARILFQTTVDVSKHHPSVYFVTVLGLVVQTAWSVWYSFTCIAIYVTYTPNSPACATNSCSSGKVAGLIFFATFVYIWVSQVIANVILCTLAGGVYGGWYYSGPRFASSNAAGGVPAKANLKSFVRAITSSLGSIALGSLIVTILELLRTIMQVVAQNERNQGDEYAFKVISRGHSARKTFCSTKFRPSMASVSEFQPILAVNDGSKKRKLVEVAGPSRTTGDELTTSASTLQYHRNSIDGGSGSDDSSTEFDDTRVAADDSKKGKSSARKRREGGKPVRKYASACQFCRRRKMKCDTVRPFCTNCIEHGEECNYERQTKPRPTHAVIQGLQEEVNHLRQLLQAKQRESQILESKRERATQEKTKEEPLKESSAQPGPSSPNSPIRIRHPTITPKEEILALPRPPLTGHPSSSRSFSVKALQQSPESTRSRLGLEEASVSQPIHQEPVGRVSHHGPSLDTLNRLNVDLGSREIMQSERTSPEPDADDVHGIAHYSTSAFFDATCVPASGIEEREHAEVPGTAGSSGSGPAGSSWGRSPLFDGASGSVGGGPNDGIKPEQEGKPEFRLPSDSHLRSHFEKVERGSRQRRESLSYTAAARKMAVTTPVVSVAEMEAINAEDLARRNELIAKAGQARHRERIDFSTGSLDYDGWPPDLVRHLLELHFNRQHHAFCITYRPAFMRDMSGGGPYFSKLLLNAILYGVSKYSDRQELQLLNLSGGLGFLDRAKTLLGQDLHEPSVPTIQALLLLANSLGAQGIAGNGSMLYLKIALAMITELGIDREDARSQALPAETREINRRVVWAAYVIDKLQSLYQGRSYSLPLHTLHVMPEFLDLYEELEEWQPRCADLPSSSQVHEHIIGEIYTGTTRRTKQARRTKRDELDRELRSWKQSLPPHLCFNPREPIHIPTPMIFSLHALYHTSTIILHRPFVESTEEFFSDSTSTTASWSACVAAAVAFTQCLRLYRQIFTIRRAPYLISYATYVASTIHVRAVAAENAMINKARAESALRGAGYPLTTETSDATKALKLCWDALVEAGKVNHGCRKAQNIIAGLMDKLDVSIGTPQQMKDVKLPDVTIPTHIGRNQEHFPDEAIFDPSADAAGVPAEDVDIESIMRSFWWPEPFDTAYPGSGMAQTQPETIGPVQQSGSGFRTPAFPSSEYSQTSTTIPSYIPSSSVTSMMNTGFDPSLGAPFHQLQQPVFQNATAAQQQGIPISFSEPSYATATTAITTSSGLGGDEFALFGSAGATSAMLDPLIGFLHEEPFYGA